MIKISLYLRFCTIDKKKQVNVPCEKMKQFIFNKNYD